MYIPTYSSEVRTYLLPTVFYTMYRYNIIIMNGTLLQYLFVHISDDSNLYNKYTINGHAPFLCTHLRYVRHEYKYVRTPTPTGLNTIIIYSSHSTDQ